MARKIDKIPPRTAANKAYHWEEWLNGDAWELTQGEDFASAIPTFQAAAHQQAYRLHLGLTCRRVGNKVYIQAQVKRRESS